MIPSSGENVFAGNKGAVLVLFAPSVILEGVSNF